MPDGAWHIFAFRHQNNAIQNIAHFFVPIGNERCRFFEVSSQQSENLKTWREIGLLPKMKTPANG